MEEGKIPVTVVDGVKIFNSTPHKISFLSETGEVVEVPSSGHLINAKATETEVIRVNGVSFVKTEFETDITGRSLVADIKGTDPDIVIVGSMIAAQAYKGNVVAMTPAPGFERVPPAEKRMNPKKFTVYQN